MSLDELRRSGGIIQFQLDLISYLSPADPPQPHDGPILPVVLWRIPEEIFV